MTLNRLTLMTAISMIVTGLTVYWLTQPGSGRQTVAPAPETPAPVIAPPSQPAAPRTATPNSDAPTAKEWNAAASVRIDGALPLLCNGKAVREWVRVACTGTNDTGGTPKDVRVTNGKLVTTTTGANGIAHTAWRTPQSPVYTAVSTSLLSLVFPFVEGTELKARFEWSDKSADFSAEWPQGAKEPSTKGAFR